MFCGKCFKISNNKILLPYMKGTKKSWREITRFAMGGNSFASHCKFVTCLWFIGEDTL